jgi:hypothetical protein
MQDRFVGNIGDFGKLALLRCLMGGRRTLAVCWYLTNGESGSKHDGKCFDYLKRADEFRHLAPEIFDALTSIVERAPAGTRGVEALEGSELLADAIFHRTTVPRPLRLRRAWSEQLVQAVREADLVFLDPDNTLFDELFAVRGLASLSVASLLAGHACHSACNFDPRIAS